MKKSIIVIVVVIIIGLVIWGITGNKGGINSGSSSATATTPAPYVPVTATSKVSDKLSQYQNDELGFAIKYPSSWQIESTDTGVTLIVPTGSSDSNTIGKLEANVVVSSGKCSFPPVTTIKDRTTITSGDLSFNAISMTNSVQGRNYYDRMAEIQNNDVCYVFSFSSITLSPASKGFTGSQATQMTNNNKALVDSADQAFTAMVKSFSYVVGDPGKDEASVVPTKK